MAVIKKKIWPKWFELVASGKKKFEVRTADFDVKEGDTLILEEWDPATKKYTGRSLTKKTNYVAKIDLDSFNQRAEIEQHGFYVIQLD